jgi:hypothetical protein
MPGLKQLPSTFMMIVTLHFRICLSALARLISAWSGIRLMLCFLSVHSTVRFCPLLVFNFDIRLRLQVASHYNAYFYGSHLPDVSMKRETLPVAGASRPKSLPSAGNTTLKVALPSSSLKKMGKSRSNEEILGRRKV